jgi:hypothetical protein
MKAAPPPIDDDVPLPARYKYPFRSFEVGQSQFVPGGVITRLSGYVANFAPALGMKFTMQTRTEKGKAGVRVWRVK